MNKSELIEAVASSADLSKASAGKVVDAVICINNRHSQKMETRLPSQALAPS